MKKLMSWLLAAALICTMFAAPVLAAEPDEICGSYVLTEADDGSGTDSSQILAMLEAFGMTATLEIREDGTATLDLLGEKTELVFDFENKLVTAEDTAVPYTYTDGVLSFGNDEARFTFTKGGAAAPRRNGPFDYYETTHPAAGDAKQPDGAEVLGMYIFASGDGLMFNGEDEIELFFDFDTMRVNSLDGDEEDAVSFSIEDDVLTLFRDDFSMSFDRADPGFAGPYAMTALKTEAEGDLTESLGMLALAGMAPSLNIDEDGNGVISVFGQTMEIKFDFENMTASAADEDGETESFPIAYE